MKSKYRDADISQRSSHGSRGSGHLILYFVSRRTEASKTGRRSSFQPPSHTHLPSAPTLLSLLFSPRSNSLFIAKLSTAVLRVEVLVP